MAFKTCSPKITYKVCSLWIYYHFFILCDHGDNCGYSKPMLSGHMRRIGIFTLILVTALSLAWRGSTHVMTTEFAHSPAPSSIYGGDHSAAHIHADLNIKHHHSHESSSTAADDMKACIDGCCASGCQSGAITFDGALKSVRIASEKITPTSSLLLAGSAPPFYDRPPRFV